MICLLAQEPVKASKRHPGMFKHADQNERNNGLQPPACHAPIGKLQFCDRLLGGFRVCRMLKGYSSLLCKCDRSIRRVAVPVGQLSLNLAGCSSHGGQQPSRQLPCGGESCNGCVIRCIAVSALGYASRRRVTVILCYI